MTAIAEPHAACPADLPLAEARRRLAAPQRPDGSLRLLGAAALLALSALLLAGSVILGPFWETKDPPAVAMARAFG